MKVLRRAGYRTVPWKNGGGVTHEVMRVPAVGDPFDWRISVAQITKSGPFSDFSGYSRTMVLLSGGGVRLRRAGATDLLLREPGDLIRFDGALPLQCDLLHGECTDLNLMVANRMGEADVRMERLADEVVLEARRASTRVVFALSGLVRLEAANGGAEKLQAWDAAVIDAVEGSLRCLGTGPGMLFVAYLPPDS